MVEFLVFNSVYWKKSVPSNGRNRVLRRARNAVAVFDAVAVAVAVAVDFSKIMTASTAAKTEI